MLKDFKAFIARGNVLDLAVGIIIGAAFGSIVSSLVDHIIMPLVGLIMGGIDFSTLVIPAGDAVIEIGLFIQSIVDFLIISFSIFMFIRLLNSVKKKQEDAEEEVVEEVNEQTELLTEIRDLLKEK